MNEMSRKILAFLKKFKPDKIVCEHPQGAGKNVLVVNMISEIIGVARAYAVEKNIEISEVNPSVWRKRVGIEQGKKARTELKNDSVNMVKEIFGIDVVNDVSDAILIGMSEIMEES